MLSKPPKCIYNSIIAQLHSHYFFYNIETFETVYFESCPTYMKPEAPGINRAKMFIQKSDKATHQNSSWIAARLQFTFSQSQENKQLQIVG